MSTVDLVDVRGLLQEKSSLVASEIEAYQEIITGSQLPDFRSELNALRREVENAGKGTDAQLVRIGIGLHLLGNHADAEQYLSQVKEDGLIAFHHANVLMSLGRYPEAEKKFKEAAKLGHDEVNCTLLKAEALRLQGKLDEAEASISSVSTNAAGRAEYSFQIGCIRADRGDMLGAIEYFERAVDMDPHHSKALFWLASENALRGNDEEAIRLYEQSLSKPPFYLAALLNLGLLYEDAENYPAAAYCFRRVAEVQPNHERANLFLKDIEATSNMYYDEEMARREAKLEQLLKRPITDFELPVRARNCLQAMNIFSLGDLTRISENELLAGKNFGETSLNDIRELMEAHDLKIGQNLHQAKAQEALLHQQNLSPQEQATLNKPIGELNLSVRARKCMNRLGITTLGELVQRTPDELLGSRNFGVTSLNEIRAKLAEIDLKLRND